MRLSCRPKPRSIRLEQNVIGRSGGRLSCNIAIIIVVLMRFSISLNLAHFPRPRHNGKIIGHGCNFAEKGVDGCLIDPVGCVVLRLKENGTILWKKRGKWLFVQLQLKRRGLKAISMTLWLIAVFSPSCRNFIESRTQQEQNARVHHYHPNYFPSIGLVMPRLIECKIV